MRSVIWQLWTAKQKKLKFYEAKGYTLRKESIGELLLGGSFYEKKAGRTKQHICGRKMTAVFEAPGLFEAVREVMAGKKAFVENTLFDINRRLAAVSVFPSVSEKTETSESAETEKSPAFDGTVETDGSLTNDGVWLVLSEAASFENVLADRDRLLLDIETRFKKREKAYRTVPEGLFSAFEGCSSYMGEIKYLAY